MLRDAAFIGRADLLHMLRQKETVIWTFVMPVLFFWFIGTVTGGFGSPGGAADRPDPLALDAPAGSGFVVDELVRRLEEQSFRVVRADEPEAFAAAARRLTVEPPAGRTATEAALAGEQVTVRYETSGAAAEGPAASFDQVRLARAVYGVVADLVVTSRDGARPTAEAVRETATSPRALSLEVQPAGRRVSPPTGYAQAVPGTMVMFTMLILLTSGSITLVVERRQGLLRRLASTPISPGSVVLGKWGARMALGVVQLAFAMVLGRLLFGVRWGATLPMVALVLLSWAALNASLAILLANLARSEGQMAGIGVLSSMVLAALGGAWWPIEITPDWMQRLALFLPTGWTMDALHRLVSFGDTAAAATPHVAGLLACALAAGWAGARTFRYQ